MIYPCKICNTESQSVYCSPECRLNGRKEVKRSANKGAKLKKIQLRKHIKIYLDYHGYKAERFDDLFIPCEWCGVRATDINHLDPRGMGGSNTKDYIENLMAMCRPCHLDYEAKLISREDATRKHLQTL